jgi:multiple sugar transport system permease protein
VLWLVLFMLAVPIGLGIALFLNQTVTGIRLYKSLFFFPFVISQVVVGLIFSWFYNPNFGVVGLVWEFFGARRPPSSLTRTWSPTASSPPVCGRRSPIA